MRKKGNSFFIDEEVTTDRMKVSLKYLIWSLALLSVILTLFSSVSSGYRIAKDTLLENTLETNRVYAQKLAQTTDSFLNETLQVLETSALNLSIIMQSSEVGAQLKNEANRLKNQSNTFNSVVITDMAGFILATSPQSLDLEGKKMQQGGGLEALDEQGPYISKPYAGMTGRLMIFISQPIISENGEYLGLVGGTLYLKEDNILKSILGEHYYQDGSYVYVVDGDGRIIYHQNAEPVNDVVPENPVVTQLMRGKSGSMRLTNTKGQDMLAGYAYIPTANWGVVSQRPTEASLEPSQDILKNMILNSLPLLLVSLIVISIISKLIASPLHKLAYYAESTTKDNKGEEIHNVQAWYYEAIELKQALGNSVDYFKNRVDYFFNQSVTDPLTKLTNRITFDEQMAKWINEGTPFSIILLDIDRFKRVNDTYGHTIGDEVLKFLANQMREVARGQDICCRFGGEEFVILLPNTNKGEAFQLGERLRKRMESTVSPSGEMVTISAGIAMYPNCATNSSKLIEIADQRLYHAKETGRNKCVSDDA